MPEAYAGPPPPASLLGAWLLNKVQELAEHLGALMVSRSADTAKMNELSETVAKLRKAIERSAKIQDLQALEIEQIKAEVQVTRKQLNGVRISRGQYRAKAEKLLEQIEQKLQ